MSTTTQTVVRPKPIRGSMKKVFASIGSVADSVRLGADILNVTLRVELVSQRLSSATELAETFGITLVEAQRLIEEA